MAVLLAALSCAAIGAYWLHGSNATHLLLIPASLLFPVACILAIIPIFRAENDSRRLSRVDLAPLVSIILLTVCSFALLNPLHKALFQWSFPTYEAVVHRIETNDIAVGTNVLCVPTSQASARLCSQILAQRTPHALIVEFDTDLRGFPARYAGYIYTSADSLPQNAFPYHRIYSEIRPYWRYFPY
jgi:hypothetical protein